MQNELRKVFSMKTKILLFTLSCFLLFSSYHSESYFQTDKIESFTPTNDFRWLTDFKILSECLSIDHFDKTSGKSYDTNGVAMLNGKYHPVNLFQYGIMCFDLYRRSNDESYKKKCITQFMYFNKGDRYKTFEDGSIGFPYEITFRDLKPTWYSGLAQAEGIMYLIRYYYLTKDERALEYIQKIKQFMIKPVTEGGTLNNLSDTEVWIEEYPNSKTKPEVINGFVTSIMALREYCLLFPSDTAMGSLLTKCLYTHKKNFYKYDLGNGIYYDLGEKQVVGAWYGKFQVVQMKQMYQLFDDTFYKDIEMLWASYAYNKPVLGMTGCLLADTNFSCPGKLMDSWIMTGSELSNLFTKTDVSFIDVTPKMPFKSLANLYDNNEQTSYSFTYADSINDDPEIHLSLNKPVEADAFALRTLRDSLTDKSFTFSYKENENSKWKHIKIKGTHKKNKTSFFSFKKILIKEFKVAYRNPEKGHTYALTEINLVNTEANKTTAFTHYTSADYNLTGEATRFKIEKDNISDFVIFYKTGSTAQELTKNKWEVYQGIHEKEFTIKSKDKLCKFHIIFKNDSATSKMKLPVQI